MTTDPDPLAEKATFGMSWFWLPEAQFGVAPGVIRTRVGYAGGTTSDPTYYNLGDHTETVDMDFDPKQTNYTNLLNIFWKNHDPTVSHCRQYMSVIFYHTDEQKLLAERTLKDYQKMKSKIITTKILPAGKFYEAESYHQKYLLQRHPSLLTMLGVSPDDLIMSHLCARLNGYAGGFGSLAGFDKEWQGLGLTEKQAQYVRNLLGDS